MPGGDLGEGSCGFYKLFGPRRRVEFMQAKQIIKNFLLWPLVALAILIIILRLSLMPLIASGANYWFKQQGVESEIGDLTLDDDDAKFTLSGLKAELNGSPVLSVDQVLIEWSWSALWDREVNLLTFNIDGLYLDIERGADNRLLIAGVDVEQLAGGEAAEEGGQETDAVRPLQWILRLQNFSLSNFKVCYRDASPQDICGRFDRLVWDGSINLNQVAMPQAEVPLRVEGDLNLSGVRIDDNRLSSVLLSADSFSLAQIRVDTLDRISLASIGIDQLAMLESKTGDAGSRNIKFDRLQLNQLSLDSSKGLQSTAGTSQAQDDARFSLSDLSASANGLTVFTVDRVALEWSWTALRAQQFVLTAFEIEGMKFDVERDSDERLVIAGVDVALLAADEAAQKSQPEPLPWVFSLQDFSLSNFKICYRDAAPQDICGRFDSLEWKGAISLEQAAMPEAGVPLQVEGDLDLSGFRVDDNQLSSVLLSADRFSLAQVRVDTLDRISLASIGIDQLTMLENKAGDAESQNIGLDRLQLNQLEFASTRNPVNTTDSTQTRHDARFSLAGIRANVDESQVFAVNRVGLEWSWASLQDQLVDLAAVEVDGLSFDIERGPGDRLLVAGIDTALLTVANQAETETIESEALPWKLRLRRLNLTDPNICYREGATMEYCGRFEKLGWRGLASLDFADAPAVDLPLQLRGDFSLSGVSLVNRQFERQLLGFEDFSVKNLQADTLAFVSSESVILDKLVLLERRKTESIPQITRLENLQANRLKLKDLNHLAIDEITLLDHQVEFLNRADNKLELSEWLERKPLDRLIGGAETESETSDTALAYTIGSLTYTTDKSITYRDNSFKPPFVFDMNTIRLSLKNLDSSKPEQDSDISYSAKIGKNALVSASGTSKPLQPKPSFDLLGKISGLDLREFSAFSARAIGHRINSGQLDAKLKLAAAEGVLKSEIDLTLNQFKLVALSAEDKQELDAKFGFPLDASLSLLRDKDNRIKLKIPITGDMQHPDFDPADAITQAISKAITTTAILFYTPYGLVVLADGLFSLATALKFEPLRFTPGEGGIAATDATALEKIAVLMRNRPGVDVTLCPSTNTADRLLLLPETRDIPVADLKLDGDQQAALTALGEFRSNQVKDYLVDQQIDPERLVLCQPVHKEGEGLSGVQISI